MGLLEEGPLHSCLFCSMLSFGPGFFLCLSLGIFFLLQARAHLLPFLLSFSEQGGSESQWPYSDTIEPPFHRVPSGDLIQNPPDLTGAFLSVAKSSELRSEEGYRILTLAFVSYSFMCTEGGRHPGT